MVWQSSDSNQRLPWDIVLVTFNSENELRENWSTLPGAIRRAVIQIDNGSSDNSVEVGEQLFDSVVSQENYGLSNANNRGARLGRSPLILFANPDLSLTEDGLSRLAGTIDRIGGIVGPQLVFPDGELQENARGWPTLARQVSNRVGTRAGLHPRTEYRCPLPPSQSGEVPWLLGAAVAMSRSTFEKTGGWDEGFFLYYEDTDLCLRARQLGIPVYLDSEIRWVHRWERGSLSFGGFAWRMHLRSAVRFYTKNPSLIVRAPHIGAGVRSRSSKKIAEWVERGSDD